MKRLALVALAVVVVLFSAVWIFIVLAVAPPLVSAVSLGVFVLAAAWLVMRQRNLAGTNPELGFFSPSSKEGLL